VNNLGSYLSGFADGEGSFCVYFSPRSRMRLGWEVRPSFSVGQNTSRPEVLNLFLEYFKCGSLRPNRGDNTMKFEIRSLKPLLEVVIPHFRKYPLLSSKLKDFEKFVTICDFLSQNAHLTEIGFKKIIDLAFEMNGLGARRYKKEYILNTLKMKI
jgi:hypothetical protein